VLLSSKFIIKSSCQPRNRESCQYPYTCLGFAPKPSAAIFGFSSHLHLELNNAIGIFSLSVNGKAIAHFLEPFVPREDPAYVEIRDEAMKVISGASTQSVLATIENTGLRPDVLFAYDAGSE